MDINLEVTRSQRRLEGAHSVRMRFHNLIVVLLMFVEPITKLLSSFIDLVYHLVYTASSYMLWLGMYVRNCGQRGRQAPIIRQRVRSRDLKSVALLGKGFSGFVYETTWYGKEKLGRFARKDFPGVDGKVFEFEAARLVNLDHPNVVKTFGWTVDRLCCSLVLEFVKDDLQTVVEKRKEARRKAVSKDPPRSDGSINETASPFELVEAIYIMWHIAGAMKYLHEQRVAHGDLRPNNVLVDLDRNKMVVKVVDVGLVKSKKSTSLVSRRAQFIKTLEWKAPETCQAFLASLSFSSDEYPWIDKDTTQLETIEGASDDYDKLQIKADVYSFGVMCSYIMGSKVSYPKYRLTDLERSLLLGSLRPEIPHTCPKGLRELIESCWNCDTQRRHDFHYLQEQLETLLRDEIAERKCNLSEMGSIVQRWVDSLKERMEQYHTGLFENFKEPHQYHTAMWELCASQQFDTSGMECYGTQVFYTCLAESYTTQSQARMEFHVSQQQLRSGMEFFKTQVFYTCLTESYATRPSTRMEFHVSQHHTSGMKFYETQVFYTCLIEPFTTRPLTDHFATPHFSWGGTLVSWKVGVCDWLEDVSNWWRDTLDSWRCSALGWWRFCTSSLEGIAIQGRLLSSTITNKLPMYTPGTEPLFSSRSAPESPWTQISMESLPTQNAESPPIESAETSPPTQDAKPPFVQNVERYFESDSEEYITAVMSQHVAIASFTMTVFITAVTDIFTSLQSDYHTSMSDLDSDYIAISHHELADLKVENQLCFSSLKEEWSHFFLDTVDTLKVAEKIAQGGQAAIHRVHWSDHWKGLMLDCDSAVLKKFKLGYSLRDLRRLWPLGFLNYAENTNKVGSTWNPRLCRIFAGLMLPDGSYGFLMEKYWGDLRKLIDLRMILNCNQEPPFNALRAKHMMLEIAEGMQFLHELNVIHRDLKASNILIKIIHPTQEFDPRDLNSPFSCVVSDFESSLGVVGVAFWRAPEVLLGLKNHMISPVLFTEKADIYSFSMTCYEILTGGIPFENDFRYSQHGIDSVLEGVRPVLPKDTDPALKLLLGRCWHRDPLERPTFEEICEELRIMVGVNCAS